MKVLISGAGVGGLALAGFLKDSDIEVVLIDKAKEWHEEGFSIGLWSAGRAMLKKLGAGEGFDKVAISFKKLVIKNGSGRTIREFDLSKFDVELGAALMHVPRGALHQWLLSAAGVPVRMDFCIDQLSEEKDGVTAVCTGGVRDTYDVVIGADGVHSAVRKFSFNAPESYVGWRAWWAWVGASAVPAHVVTEYVEPREFIMLSREGERTLAVLMAPADHTVWDTEQGRIKRLEEVFKSETGVMPMMLQGLSDKDAMPSDLMTVKAPRWHTGRTVLIGDAAHAMVPFTALGATLALEDAYVLAGELIKAKEDGDISGALERYEHKRRPRVRRAHALTARMRTASITSSSLWRSALNAVMPWVPAGMVTGEFVSFLKEEI